MTAYPDAEDYLRAVQQPQDVFRVPALRSAEFALHPTFGIPMPASGNAAVVFRAGVGGVDAALRFFIREDVSTRQRYTALGRHFTDHGLQDCVASAIWVDDAITINGATWPVVQMQWIDGRPLDEYAGYLATMADVGALWCLAETWRALVARLQSTGFAHGDLQHGNVLVDSSSALRLVDFDGSWIAAFRGEPPPRETGHPNYQSAGREWGRWMDTFPGLVVYTALLVMSRRPEAWRQLHNGENMLFSRTDFAPPFHTPAWELVTGIGDVEVDRAAQRLKLACAPGWRADGPLESLLSLRPTVVVPGPRPAPHYPGVGVSDAAARWWEPAAGSPPPSPLPGRGMPTPPPKSWTDEPTVDFAHAMRSDWPQRLPVVDGEAKPVKVGAVLTVIAVVLVTALLGGVVGAGPGAIIGGLVAAAIAIPLLLKGR